MRPVLQEGVERKLAAEGAPGAAFNSSAGMVDELVVFLTATLRAAGDVDNAIAVADLAARGALRGPLQDEPEER